MENDKKECRAYFLERSVYKKLFAKIQEKYAGIGHFGGTFLLDDLTKEEKEQLGGFLQKDFSEQKNVRVTAKQMEKALQSSRFCNFTWEEILELYTGRALLVKKEEKQKEPFLKLVQTSSSHEPFEVPFHRLYDKILNSFAYADSCVGDFVKQYQETPLWKNTLFVLVPDHQGAYPYPIENPLDGQTIPLILIGGAIKQPLVVDTYASQIDIAATLLAQLGLPHDEFTFSKNIMNPASPHFAYFTRPNYFGMITADNQLVYNLDANTVQLDEGTAKGANLEKGKAFLQKLYDDLAKR